MAESLQLDMLRLLRALARPPLIDGEAYVPATHAELAAKRGVSRPAVHQQLQRMERRGLIRKDASGKCIITRAGFAALANGEHE